MTRVLILGGTGMLGHKMAQVLAADPSLEVHASVRGLPPEDFLIEGVDYHPGVDLSEGSPPLGRLLSELTPEVVVNAIGAIKQRDLAAAMDETFFLNGSLPHVTALLNPNPAGRVIHVSTDCVFIGDRGMYQESDTPDATDLYGRSKAAGELYYGPHVTVRTSIIGFDFSGGLGLLSWLFSQPPGSAISGFSEAYFSGLPTVTLARTIRRLIHDPGVSGLYHVASERIAKFDLLSRANARFELGLIITPDDGLRIDRSLDDTRFRDATGSARPGWNTLMDDLHDDYGSLPYPRVYASLREQRKAGK